MLRHARATCHPRMLMLRGLVPLLQFPAEQVMDMEPDAEHGLLFLAGPP